MATVTNTIKLPDGSTPSYAAVVIELVASTTSRAAGWITASDTTILSVARPTVTAGAWTASLTPNADITPSGTVYKVTETADKVRYIHYIEVGSGGGTVHDLLVDAPGSLATAGSEAFTTAAVATHAALTAGAHAATAITVADSGNNYSGTTVEAALSEVGDSLASHATSILTIETIRDLDVFGDAMQYVSLLAGQDDETPLSATSCTTSTDTVNTKINGRALKASMAGAVTATVIFDPVSTIADPVSLGWVSAVGLWVYCYNASAVNYVQVELYQSNVGTAWSRTSINAGVTLADGWNLVRWPAHTGTVSGWNLYRIRLLISTSGACDVTFGHLWAEKRQKASLVLVNDGVYKSFVDYAYPGLKAAGYPVVWAPDPDTLGDNVGTISERASVASLQALMADGNGNSCSFHGWDGAVTSSMTEAEIRTDTIKAQKWIAQNIPPGQNMGRFWRAAWTQNSATNASAADGLLWAAATPTNTASLAAWPPTPSTVRAIPRYALHGRSEAAIDTLFTSMENTRELLVAYTHGVDAGGGTNITAAMWDYIKTKIDTGVAAGWLEVVTLETLFFRSGGRCSNVAGGLLLEWTGADGTQSTMVIP